MKLALIAMCAGILLSSNMAHAQTNPVTSFIKILPYGYGDYEGLTEAGKPCTVHVIPQMNYPDSVIIHAYTGIFDKTSYILSNDANVFKFDLATKTFKQKTKEMFRGHEILRSLETIGLDHGALTITISNMISEGGEIKKDLTINCTVI